MVLFSLEIIYVSDILYLSVAPRQSGKTRRRSMKTRFYDFKPDQYLIQSSGIRLFLIIIMAYPFAILMSKYTLNILLIPGVIAISVIIHFIEKTQKKSRWAKVIFIDIPKKYWVYIFFVGLITELISGILKIFILCVFGALLVMYSTFRFANLIYGPVNNK